MERVAPYKNMRIRQYANARQSQTLRIKLYCKSVLLANQKKKNIVIQQDDNRGQPSTEAQKAFVGRVKRY